MTKDIEILIRKLIYIKECADGKRKLIANQGQAMDGFSELYNYRDIIEKIRNILPIQ